MLIEHGDFRFSNSRKRGEINIWDFLLFFKVKSEKDLSQVRPEEFVQYSDLQRRVENIILSFQQFPIKLQSYEASALVPEFFWRRLEASERLLWLASIDDAKSRVDDAEFKRILQFFQSFPSSLLPRLNFDIKTEAADAPISLSFAENFRFKSSQNSLNIFNLQKELRNVIIPQDSSSKIFVADFRQFEFRTFLKIQELDSYFSHENIYEKIGADLKIKSSPKESIIAYMYGSKNTSFESFFGKEKLLSRVKDNLFWFDNFPVYVKPEYESGKKIHTIIQTISQYVYLNKLEKILNLMENKKSKFIFPLHDSVILSISRGEEELIDQIIDELEDDTYKVKCYVGDNFRDVVEI